MGLGKDVREDFDRGRRDARLAMASRRLSTNTVMKLRLSLFWPAALAMVISGFLTWRVGGRSIALASAAALAAGLVTLALFALLLGALLKRARLADGLPGEETVRAPSGPAQPV